MTSRSRPARNSLWLYSLAWWCLTPALIVWLLWRALRQAGYLRAVAERFGFIARTHGARRLIWVHAVSVGETRAAEPLIRALAGRWPDAELLITHMTPTGRATGAAVFSDLISSGRLRQAWLPWDFRGATRRFLTRTRPTIGVLMETELWPNLVAAAARCGVPLVLANARLSDKSLRKGERWRSLIVPALLSLDRVLAQTPSDAERLARLGRADVPVLGNLKFDIEPPAALIALGTRWRERLLSRDPSRGIVLAASTREGEEAMLLDAWTELRTTLAVKTMPILVIVPRHPQRFNEVAHEAQHRGGSVVRRSAFSDQGPEVSVADVDVIIGDSMGEMFAWYAMADVAIIGGSLAPLGGQNLIEACAVGCPVLLGPHTFNFQEISADAIAAGAANRVQDAGDAVRQALNLLDDDARRRSMRTAAGGFARQHRGATVRTLDALEDLIG